MHRGEGGEMIVSKAAPLIIWLAFMAVAVALWLTLDNAFYLVNFLYIGAAVSVGGRRVPVRSWE
jgi:hypothetical protein